MKKYTIALSLLLSLFTCAVFALSPARTYDVQVVIFSHITPKTLAEEQWPVLSPADLKAFTENTTPAKPATGLQQEENTLRMNRDYQVLFSGSWQESWYGNRSSVTIPLSNNNNLKGSLTISLGDYFSVHTMLLLTQSVTQLQKMATNSYFNAMQQPNFYFQLNENRRMRSDELNYINTPVMGMLIKIVKPITDNR